MAGGAAMAGGARKEDVSGLELVRHALGAADGFTIADVWERRCDAHPERPAFQYVGCDIWPAKRVSFAQMDAMANQVAHWALGEGIKKGDVVALYMENRLEYVASWLGLCKAGVVVSFINNTIKHQPLVHSVAISKAKVLLFGAECCEAVEGVFRVLAREHGVESVCQGGACAFARSVDAALAKQPLERPPRALRAGVPFTDVFGFVYTSGTTGLPKAVRVTHLKQWGFAAGYGKLVGPEDVVYSAGMPLYHSSAGGIGTGMVYHYGAMQVLRRKFSATAWLGDIRKYRATVCQYIGELCRYVLATPERPDDADNTLRLATGNGLSKEIWVPFQTRFGIDVVREFFGSTEGNGAFKNDVLLADIRRGDLRGVGCIGRLGSSKGTSGQRFCRYDVDADELVRDAQGRLVDCEPDEPGECLMPVLKNNPITTFVGYTDAESTKKKTVEDRGVTYFRTGDLLVVTKDRYVRFVDRIGDTFRWRGENVSTFEVSSELSKCPLVQEANVYGVKVPHVEGRAGMAAIVLRPDAADASRDSPEAVAQQMQQILAHARACLPSYAVPLFLRLQPATATTQTFKHQKAALRKEGLDPREVDKADRLFWLHPATKTYQRFTLEDYVALEQAKQGGPQSRL